ncbi:MAG: Uncharacterised protein [Owenweeksia sp. TMED14]|nr:MAG: Uncharacterised protein [Owenweeksia sp. TMED14]|tara:strand:- start:8796 stop:9497 length:702 start_codon:yes stop_codon:yes gene_type:complete
MVSVFQKSLNAYRTSYGQFLLMGFICAILSALSPAIPSWGVLISTYFIIPSFYLGIGMNIENPTQKLQINFTTLFSGFKDFGATGTIILIQLFSILTLLAVCFSIVLDENTLNLISSIQKESGEDVIVMQKRILEDINWNQYKFLLLASFLLLTGMMSLGLQSIYIRFHESQGIIKSIISSYKRAQKNFSSWIILSIFFGLTHSLQAIHIGFYCLLIPLVASVHYFLYKESIN